jgi:hypothetical protein
LRHRASSSEEPVLMQSGDAAVRKSRHPRVRGNDTGGDTSPV